MDLTRCSFSNVLLRHSLSIHRTQISRAQFVATQECCEFPKFLNVNEAEIERTYSKRTRTHAGPWQQITTHLRGKPWFANRWKERFLYCRTRSTEPAEGAAEATNLSAMVLFREADCAFSVDSSCRDFRISCSATTLLHHSIIERGK